MMIQIYRKRSGHTSARLRLHTSEIDTEKREIEILLFSKSVNDKVKPCRFDLVRGECLFLILFEKGICYLRDKINKNGSS